MRDTSCAASKFLRRRGSIFRLVCAGGRLCVHEGILPPPPSLWSDGGSLSHTFLRNVRGMARMPPTGGSPDWGIPCVPQRFTPQTVPSVIEHAQNTLRRTLYPARRDEFFLYEKMGRRAIVPAGSISEAGSTSEVGGRAQAPVPTPPKKWESKGTHLRIRRSRIPRCVVSRRTAERESRALAAFPRCKSALRGHLTFIIVYEWGVICKCSSLK